MKALAAGGTEDHAHLLLSLPPTISISTAMREIKSGSSRWMHETANLPQFRWQEAYGASVSYTHLDVYKRQLNRHIREGWTGIVAQELGEFIEILPPMQRVSANWYMGTADAVYQNIYSIGAEQPKHVLILSGDHIYKMNYSKMLEHHVDTGADVTLATLPILPEDVKRFGVVEVGKSGEVVGFLEKPASTKLRSPFNPDMVDASMGLSLIHICGINARARFT